MATMTAKKDENVDTTLEQEVAVNATDTAKQEPANMAALNAHADGGEVSIAKSERDNIAALHAQKKVKIIIPSGKSQAEQCPVPVSINGREFLIMRDIEVEVPKAVVDVLELATEMVPMVDEANRITQFRAAPRFPFREVSG